MSPDTNGPLARPDSWSSPVAPPPRGRFTFVGTLRRSLSFPSSTGRGVRDGVVTGCRREDGDLENLRSTRHFPSKPPQSPVSKMRETTYSPLQEASLVFLGPTCRNDFSTFLIESQIIPFNHNTRYTSGYHGPGHWGGDRG